MLCWKWLGVPGGSRSSLFSHLPSHPHPRPLIRGLTNYLELSVQGSNFWITFPPTTCELGTSTGNVFYFYKVTLGSVFPGMLISSCWFIPISIMLMLLIFSRTLRYLTLQFLSRMIRERMSWLGHPKFKGRTNQGPFKTSLCWHNQVPWTCFKIIMANT